MWNNKDVVCMHVEGKRAAKKKTMENLIKYNRSKLFLTKGDLLYWAENFLSDDYLREKIYKSIVSYTDRITEINTKL
jgi:hypothetical protein